MYLFKNSQHETNLFIFTAPILNFVQKISYPKRDINVFYFPRKIFVAINTASFSHFLKN
jgi:hypothetical protein